MSARGGHLRARLTGDEPVGGLGHVTATAMTRSAWARLVLGVTAAISLWAAWTLLHGALSGWYPYAIIDASKLGYPAALRTSALILLLIAGIAGLNTWLDRVRSRRSATPTAAPLPH